jgi:predicted metalloprotease with PDZ domain
MIMTNLSVFSQKVDYNISIKNPNSHYATVQLTVDASKSTYIDFKMPVWAPGSYMVREFERNIDRVAAKVDGQSVAIQKTDKSTWRVYLPKKHKSIEFEYDVYCFEQSVRTSYINTDHAFLILTSVLMYVDNAKQTGMVSLVYPNQWNKVSCTLEKTNDKTFKYNNYDELVDSPIEIGNHEEWHFEVAGVPHSVAMVGLNNSPKEQFLKDITKTCSTMYNIVGQHPCKSYLFIVHHVEMGGGGLEHANSCVVQIPRYNYSNHDKYNSFLGLLAHEYFHLWNVKRIRPAALGPFDYSKENHTNLLWVAEGITSYYDELAMYRAGFVSQKDYLKSLASTITSTLNRKGGEMQSMHAASFDAWIKEYRGNENSINSNISYYLKGSVLAAVLDIKLILATEGKKGLDDLMKLLYNNYYIKLNRGFSDEEFYNSIDEVAGKKLNFRTWAEGTNDSKMLGELKVLFAQVGVQLNNEESKLLNYTGIITEIRGNQLYVKSIESGSPAWTSDIQSGDEILAINDNRVLSSMDDLVLMTGPELNILLNRAGLIKSIKLKALASPKYKLSLEANEKPSPFKDNWLKL